MTAGGLVEATAVLLTLALAAVCAAKALDVLWEGQPVWMARDWGMAAAVFVVAARRVG